MLMFMISTIIVLIVFIHVQSNKHAMKPILVIPYMTFNYVQINIRGICATNVKKDIKNYLEPMDVLLATSFSLFIS